MKNPSQNQMAIAALFAALVEALDEKSDGIALSFARHLDGIQAKLAENGADNQGVIETLSWTKTLLRDDLDRMEPANVVYAKTWSTDEAPLPSSEKIQLPTLEKAVRFWASLPSFDQANAEIETASGHRLDAKAAAALSKRYKGSPIT